MKDRFEKRAAVEKVTKQSTETTRNVTKRATVQKVIKRYNCRFILTPESSSILPQTPKQYANFVLSPTDSAPLKRTKAFKKKSLTAGQKKEASVVILAGVNEMFQKTRLA